MKHLLVPLTRLTVLLFATGLLLFAQTSATYLGLDTETKGNWTGHYGSDGYQIANGGSLIPSYGSVGITASAYTWTSNAAGSPALQTASGASTYIASTYLAATAFTINVNLTDGNSHTVALYLLDWDGGGQRAETITVQNAATGAAIPTVPVQSLTGFDGGVWVTYTVTGNVNFVIQSTNSYFNALVSGVFFSPSSAAPQPQTITFGTVATQTVGTPLALTATASSGLPVSYAASPGAVCTVSGTTATFLTGGSNCTITASQAGNGSWDPATPVSQTFSVSSSGSSGQTSATFSKLDTSTQGNWTGHYGSDGYQIANSGNVSPSYGSASISASAYTWTSNAAGSPALQTASGADTYIASTYLAATALTVNVNLTDGKSHTVAFYLLDWDSSGQRAETITAQNATTGASFTGAPVQSVTNFQGGVWVIYTVTGNVNFVFQSTNSYFNAIVSGIFFSPSSTAPQAQTITFGPIAAQTVGTPLALAAMASSGLPVSYTSSPGAVCTISGTTATFLTGGSCTITATQAGDSDWAAASPVAQTFNVSSAGTSGGQTEANYSGLDTATQGNWPAQYGSDGYVIANDGPGVSPSYGSVSFSASAYTWNANAAGSPALLTAPNTGTYIASAYLASTALTINVNLTDGKSHRVSFYLLDWDSGGQRAESITAQDASTGSSFLGAPVQNFTSFQNGVWVSYTVTGNVNFVIQSTNPYINAVVSGIFFGTASSTPPATPPSTLGPQVTVFTSANQWLSEALTGSASSTVNGAPGVSALGDYDGDGLVDAVTFLNGSFSVSQLSGGGSSVPKNLWEAGDIAVPGDYDGDGKTDYAAFRLSTGSWYYLPSGSPNPALVQVQAPPADAPVAGDTPVPGDFDGDGKTDFVFYRISTSIFYSTLSGTPNALPYLMGQPGDLPVVGDYDGDGVTDYAVFRPSTGTWYYRLSTNTSIVRAQLMSGTQAGDVPMPGDYDGDGKTDFAMWRPSAQTWQIILSSNLTQITVPMPGASASATPVSLAPFTKEPGVALAVHKTPGTYYTLSGAICLTTGSVNNQIVCPNGGTSQLVGVSVTVATSGGSSWNMLTDSNGSYSFTLPAHGTYTVTASLAGYTFAAAANTPSLSNLTANPLVSFLATPIVGSTPQTITFSAISSQTVGTTLSLSAASNSGLPVTYSSQTTSVCTVSGGTASFVAAGTCTIEAAQLGNSTYAAASPVNQSFGVNPAGPPPGSLSPNAPLQEYIYFNGQIIAIEHAH